VKKNKKSKWLIDDESEYIGNIWGWDISMIGAIVVIVLGLIIAYRFYSLPDRNSIEKVEQIHDSTSNSN
jgi:hypothetical protein